MTRPRRLALLTAPVALAALTGGLAAAPAAQAGPTALRALAGLHTAAYGPSKGYTATAFGRAWADTDGNGCDNRDDVLWRDSGRGAAFSTTDRCVVTSAAVRSAYTGRTLRYTTGSRAVSVDRVVPLPQAWRSGARSWGARKRQQFAEDPLNLVTGEAALSRTRAAKDASGWLPAGRVQRCAFAARTVAVLRTYALSVTKAERVALQRALAPCPRQALPTGTGIPARPKAGSTPADPGTPAKPGTPTTPGSPGSPGTPGTPAAPTTPGTPGTPPPAGSTLPPVAGGTTPSPAQPWTPDQKAPSFTPDARTLPDLRLALEQARPGTVITLEDGVYPARLELDASGTAAAPIVLRGTRGAIIDVDRERTGTALTVKGSWWVVQGITLRDAQRGVLVQGGSHVVLDGIDVHDVGNEGVRFRGTSDDVLQGSDIHETGINRGNLGQGVEVGSPITVWQGGPDRADRITVTGNRIWRTTAAGVDVKEGTSGALVTGNHFWHVDHGHDDEPYGPYSPWVGVAGNDATVTGNRGDGGTPVWAKAPLDPRTRKPLEGYALRLSADDNTTDGAPEPPLSDDHSTGIDRGDD
ncbi:parallel beta helix pectate lyase-like protein [Motilibacter rhizosphaerae]|uniref:Parallel beta helix pectate lyase-like protein n=1 Tax=Motilibacter rhizosphaerae TaxID=598652 RepID=A0A4Q7NAD6_9ACTN|nr:right-handed parallel beta-helix repeat-containing protein [Motilibacter rhizosphaerae]RZS78994.1 parallel beta helix pectate lyase-like protein [Motilibacter rhizosphaerae]